METVDEGESEEQIPDNDVTMEDSLPEMRVLKRKLSPEELEPKKQARLEPPNHVPQEDADNADKANGTPLSSPLGARKRDADRAPSFSGLNRRLSFTERPASSHGLGLDSTQSASVPDDTRLSPTSVPPSSAPIRRSSINQHPSTPAKLQTPADKVKQLQSALRKDSPAERTPERRSVSFSGEDHVFPTVPAPKSVPQTANKEEKKAAKSGVLPEPVSQETEDQSEEKAEAGLFAEVNMETNEYEEELLRAEDLDPKGDYVRKLKLASKRWQVMINNKNKTRTREIERYHNAIRDLKTLNRELLELNEFNAPPTQRPRSQTPNGTPATRKLSRPETTCSQGRKSGEHWNVEILTPKPNSKKLMSKDVPAPQKSRKSEEEDGQQEEVEGHWEVEIHTPRPNGTPLRQSESKKLSSPKRPPTPSEESGSEEESSSEKETESAVPNSVTKPSPPDKVSKREAKPVSQSGLDSEEEQSGSDEEGSDSEEAEEEAAEAAAAVAEAVQNDKTPTTTKPNPESQPSSKPDPQSDEETSSGSDSESEASDASSGSESEKENQLPKPTPQTKADLLRRTSLNLPSSQNKSSNDHPTSSQSTPTGPRAPRQTLKGLLRKQREEQSEKARAKAEAEKVQRQRQQPHKDIFSGPSDSESEEESDSSSDSGADAGDILSSGTVGKLRPAFGRK
ncbi:hypothetical protein BDV23DRAFT_146281 [Aspergillus alliaceus]|uniref:Uncharacterized protein n=1 Tax=Petromyces alliaceus TaxID=209559 RepID=A0A5N7CLQ7_PETAA|nr:hypothetical protein BDV23DRAFT_146281 [Aspergillus alliaceus]